MKDPSLYPAKVDEQPWYNPTVIRQGAAGISAADFPNPKQAFGDKKVPLQLVPPSAMIYIALGLREGVEDYGAWNWRDTKVEAMTYIGSTLRHIADFVDGYDTDPDNPEKPSLAGAIANLAILIDALENDSLIDNRPPKGSAAEMFKKWKLD